MPYITSTAANDMNYTEFATEGYKDGIHTKLRSVLVRGGSGVARRHKIAADFITEKGVQTYVTDDELEFLQKNVEFQNHVKRGFLSISRHKAAGDKVANSMNLNDESRPLVNGDPRMKMFTKPDERNYIE